MESIWFFDKVDLFDILCPHKLEVYQASHDLKIYGRGEYIYFSDDPSKSIYLVASGKVKILKYTETGEEFVKAILSKGEIFGELAVLGEDRRSDFAVSIDEETMLCHMNIEQLQELMVENKNFTQKIHKLIASRITMLERRLDSLIFKDVQSRIIDFIRDFAEQRGVKKGREVFIKSYFTHKDIADLVGTTRQTVTSTLNDLKNRNLISFNRKSLVVHNIDSLVIS